MSAIGSEERNPAQIALRRRLNRAVDQLHPGRPLGWQKSLAADLQISNGQLSRLMLGSVRVSEDLVRRVETLAEEANPLPKPSGKSKTFRVRDAAIQTYPGLPAGWLSDFSRRTGIGVARLGKLVAGEAPAVDWEVQAIRSAREVARRGSVPPSPQGCRFRAPA